MRTRSEHSSFGGTQGFYEIDSAACGGPMRFGVYIPPNAKAAPALYYLAGLTCTEETFAMKAGAQRVASELGLAIVTCDTSPRHARFPGDDADWDFGLGAGFYLDATQAPWSAAYKMETHVVDELRAAVEGAFPIARDRRGITGHSMGGHGALTLALRHADLYRSASAFAPVCAPMQVPWGQKAFRNYLATDGADHDACALITAGKRFTTPPLVDQGLADEFLETQLRPDLL
ncbi:MAG TPA: S-formylglutathione hydrolase, partial [Kofleriaceae bacterium]|nr:S-formylglutathione hydrolase [Kofleriaceae bacterium]